MMRGTGLAQQRAGGGKGGGRTNKPVRLPAPIGGWNTRDAVESMEPQFAILLENWIPGVGGIRSREGVQPFASGMPARVATLMEYAPSDASIRKFFAAAGAGIYDVSSPGPVGAAVQSGLTSALFSHTMFSNSAGNFLGLVNGFDAPRYFNGSTWSTPAITGTGLTANNLIQIAAHQNRLWFVEKATLHGWYLATSAISGAIVKFDFGGLCKLGGELMAIGTWTRDGGAGQDDLFVAVTSEGEVLIYSGTDPASPSTWALVGVFRLPKPVGRNCLIKSGADLAVFTVEGPLSLAAVLPTTATLQANNALTANIKPSFRAAYASGSSDTRWGIIEHPTAGLVIINVPTASASISRQFALSADTGGWADWTNINGSCMGLFNERLYFGRDDGTVHVYGGSSRDGTMPITARVQTAFHGLGGIADKLIVMARPVMQGPPGFVPNFVIRMDYDTTPPDVSISVAPASAGSPWDTSPWDTSPWSVSAVPILSWQTVEGLGTAVSVAFAITTDVEVTMQAIDLLFERGTEL